MVRALGIGDPQGEGGRLEEGVGIIGVAADVEGELVVGLDELRAVEEVADASVGIGLQLADELGVAVGVEADITRADDLHRMIQTAVDSFGRLDVLVNNAGMETRQSLLDTTEEDYEKVMSVNMKSAFFASQAAAERFIDQGEGGLILNIMPCVFPILSLKALSLARGGASEREARYEALAYTAGVVLVCLSLGAAILALRAGGSAVGWAFQLQHPAAIIVLLLLSTAIAFNLAGLFEVPTPRFAGGAQCLFGVPVDAHAPSLGRRWLPKS